MVVKVLNLKSQKVYEIDLSRSGENAMPCPECSESRKKKKDKCFSFNSNKKAGYCNHCDSRFVEYRPFEKKIDYKKPEWKNFTDLSDKALQWFQDRLIGVSTLQKMKVSSKRMFMPQQNKEVNCIAFPFYKSAELINVKYRDGAKNFCLESGAEITWYNHKAIAENKEIIITEGEIDALSFMQEGFDNVISVPNGANVNLPFFNPEDFEHLESVYLAVDNDQKGIELRNELQRRIGADICYMCSFKEHKDANEYLINNGYGSLKEVIQNAEQPRIEGVYTAEDFLPEIQNLYQNGLPPGIEIGVEKLDEIVKWEIGRLCITTGTPSSGKSEFIDYKAVKLNITKGWKWAIWSPENHPLFYHYSKIAEKILGVSFKSGKITSDMFWSAYEYIKDNFIWVDPEDFTLDNILKKFKYCVKKYGIKGVILDPYNNLGDRVEYNQQGEQLDKMRNFARHNNVLFELVAHPRKLEKLKDGTFPVPTMYDISGSSDFWNKADYGIALLRERNAEKMLQNYGQAVIQKVKFKHLGTDGVWQWKYNYNNGRYEEYDSTVDYWDNSNWLTPDNEEIKKADFMNGLSAQSNDTIEFNKPWQINDDELPF